MSSRLANLIDSLSAEEQQELESWILHLKHRSKEPAAGATANRGFPFGAGAKDPLVRGTLAEQDSLWRAMTSKEADDFYEGRY
jgi:hypothetical protein